MTETIRRKICDVCKREVYDFAGSLNLTYSEGDYTKIGYRYHYPIEIIYKDICIDCCRKLHTAIAEALND